MSATWLDQLLPQISIRPRTRILWALFFVLFPLAYLGGIALQSAKERPARIEGAMDRDMSIKVASTFAMAKGFAVAGWHTYAVAETHDDLLAYYTATKDPDPAIARGLAPAREVEVLFRSPDYSEEFRVYLALNGHIAGFNIGKSSGGNNFTTNIGMMKVASKNTSSNGEQTAAETESKPLPAPEAEDLAKKALAASTELAQIVQLGEPKITNSDNDPARTDLEWNVAPPGLKGLVLKIKASVRPSQLIAQRIEAHVDQAYAANNPVRKRKAPVFLNTIYGFFLAFAALYASYRYARRSLQKEVSHARTLIVALIFFVSYSVLAYCTALDLIATKVNSASFMAIILVTNIASLATIAIMGLLVGIGYGSGEGEVREAYPGKLTSLDSLLAGRFLSADVGASVLCGAAMAGWLLLCHHALGLFLLLDIDGARSDALSHTFARLPWLAFLVGKQYDSLLMAVAGLLVPASFLSRRGVRKRRRFGWLILFALFAVLHDAAADPIGKGGLLSAVVFMAALLLPFFAFDLLAAIVSMSTFVYADDLGRLSAIFPSWTTFSLALSLVMTAILGLAAYLALRGKRVREEEVRPKYAKNLAERMSLQAEVLAAREAQLRLLPQSVPDIPGFQLAACCLPAREVGGDFYDFFRLDANRLGIFVAQGGEQGLASALCIALAKGVLMHSSLEPQSPTQIVLGLEQSLVELLEDGSAAGICFVYAVVDTQRKVLNYARLGDSPRLLIRRDGATLTTAARLEREVVVHSRSQKLPVCEGAAFLQTGDYLIFFTHGIASLRIHRLRNREYQWLEILMREMSRHEEPLQTSLSSTLAKYHQQASRDLTAVVMRAVESEAAAQEVVA